jgi:hypothetical protein
VETVEDKPITGKSVVVEPKPVSVDYVSISPEGYQTVYHQDKQQKVARGGPMFESIRHIIPFPEIKTVLNQVRSKYKRSIPQYCENCGSKDINITITDNYKESLYRGNPIGYFRELPYYHCNNCDENTHFDPTAIWITIFKVEGWLNVEYNESIKGIG